MYSVWDTGAQSLRGEAYVDTQRLGLCGPQGPRGLGLCPGWAVEALCCLGYL